MDSSELVERYLILLLGVKKEPVPSDVHLQKEIFILSNFRKSLLEEFNFQKHYLGPYSQVIDEAVKSPAYFSEAFEFDGKKVYLSGHGREEYLKMIKEFQKEEEFKLILSSLSIIRNIYDKLSKDELLFLVYETYPEYTELSNIYLRLNREDFTRRRIINSLHAKGLITDERHRELENAR